MPRIETKDQNKIYNVLATKLTSKVKKDPNLTQAVSPKKSNSSKDVTFLSGTFIPNSTIREKLNKTSIVEEKPQKFKAVASIKTSNVKNVPKSQIKNDSSDARYSIVSGSSKLQELQELQQKLRKTSYHPPTPSFAPRRPTIESIKLAIEKAKELERATNKSVGTNDDKSSVEYSDASTGTNSQTQKKVKKKKKKTRLSGTTSLQISQTKFKKLKKKPDKNQVSVSLETDVLHNL